MGILAVLGLPLAATPWLNSFALAMAIYFLSMFCAAGFIILSIAYATDVYSIRHSGLISGIGSGAWSATVAVLMPVFGRLFDQGAWPQAFGLAAALPVGGYLLWLAANRERATAKSLRA
jgi:MFS family permease